MQNFFIPLIALLIFVFSINSVDAITSSQVNRLIEQAKVPTYDCPDNEFIGQIEEMLEDTSLTDSQRNSLSVRKTHWQICVGKHTDAKNALTKIVANPKVDTNSEYYANALYQLGFLYDVQENDQRCDYYQQARQLSQNKFPDVALSSQLGLLTVCNADTEDGIKLGKMYALLEQYSANNDKAAVAHIHNNIGLFYGALGQQALAAEQFRKSYEMGLGTYKGSNQLATLISVISAQLAAGDYPAAKASIEEFKHVNKQINTPQTNIWLHFAEAGYYYRLENYPELKDSLARWKVYMPQISNPLFEGFHRWYSAKLCLIEKDRECLTSFLEQEENASSGYKTLVNANKDYLKFRVQIYLFLGDLDKVEESFNHFSDVLIKQFMDRQEAGKIMGVANLHSQIINLENSLERAKSQQTREVIFVVAAFILLLIMSVFLIRAKLHGRKSYDAATQLLDRKAAFNQIRNVNKPSSGKINALAIFDLGKFIDVNLEVGSIDDEFVLEKIASSLVHATRERDILGRISKEQFIVCLTNIEEQTANSFLERIRNALESTLMGNEHGQPVSIESSFSIFISNEGFSDLEDVINDMQISLSKG